MLHKHFALVLLFLRSNILRRNDVSLKGIVMRKTILKEYLLYSISSNVIHPDMCSYIFINLLLSRIDNMLCLSMPLLSLPHKFIDGHEGQKAKDHFDHHFAYNNDLKMVLDNFNRYTQNKYLRSRFPSLFISL